MKSFALLMYAETHVRPEHMSASKAKYRKYGWTGETSPAIPYVDKAIDSGAKSLQKRATSWVDSKIDQSG